MLLLSIVAASSLSDRARRIKLFPSINNSSCYSNDRIVAHNLPTFAHNLTPLPIPKCSHTCVLILAMKVHASHRAHVIIKVGDIGVTCM